MLHFPYDVIEIGRCKMKRSIFLPVIVLALAVVLPPPDTAAQKSQSAEVLLGAALHQEEVEGNLEAAIETYKKLLADYPDNRPVAARALFQTGQCYEKLGKGEARRAYERLVRDYADQSEQVKLARSRLAALMAPGPVTMTARKLENPPDDAPMGAVSPDGRHISYGGGRTGDLVVRDLKTGQDRQITDEGTDDKEGVKVSQRAGISTWSPDSKQIAYGWYVSELQTKRAELRIVGLDGGKPRVLTHFDGVRELGRCVWSPDGKSILVSGYDDNYWRARLLLVSVTDGSNRTLTEFTAPFFPLFFAFSPDGRTFAYDRLPDDTSPERDIYLMSIDSGQAVQLARHPADDYLLGWSGDGQWIVFASDRTGALGLWAIGMSGIKAQGEPRLVKPAIERILPLALTREGALYYGVVRATEDVFVAGLDPATGKITGPPRKAIEAFEGGNFSPSYSPDGKCLAYVSRRGNSPYPTNRGNALCVRSLDTGQERVFYREIWRLGLRFINGPEWSPDGRSIVFDGQGGSSGTRFYRIDLETSKITPVMQAGPDERIQGGACGPDGEYFFSRANTKAGFSQIMVRNVESGDEREMYRFPMLERGNQIALSPDGRWLSFINFGWGGVRSLRVMPSGGGEAREIWSFGETETGTPPMYHRWSPDGRHIFFGGLDQQDRPNWKLWRVPIEGGKPEGMGLQRQWGLWDLTVSPDGRQIAFAGRGGASTESELWILENFLPPAESSK